MTTGNARIVCLSGGVGGARLVHGLAAAVDPARLTVIVNTGDDFTHWGLSISPDLDTVMYTLAELADVARGWGLAHDTFDALAMVQRLGGEAWFQLGDRDLGTHVMRSQWLREGASLTEVTTRLCSALGVRPRILPMSDEPCETLIDTAEGTLTFQEWLVGRRGALDASRVWARTEAHATSAVLHALDEAELVVFGPSNPYVSIDPILKLPGVRERIAASRVIAVSPIVHGQAVKGPLARMLYTLAGREASPRAVLDHYRGLVHGLVVERGDAAALGEPAELARVHVLETDTIMSTRAQSLTLANEVLRFAQGLPSRTSRA